MEAIKQKANQIRAALFELVAVDSLTKSSRDWFSETKPATLNAKISQAVIEANALAAELVELVENQ